LGINLNRRANISILAKCTLLLLLLVLSSCNITKRLKENEYLVDKNKIIDLGKTRIPKDNIEAFIKQKPNRKIANIVPFNLWLYNQIDKEKLLKKKEKRDLRYARINVDRLEKNDARNERQAKKGKSPKEPRLKNKDKPTIRESLLELAEAPVIYDSTAAHQTSKQITRYLFSKGYFHAKVKDSVTYNRRAKKATVKYYLMPGKLYTIESIHYKIPDEQLAYYIYNDTIHTLLKRNEPFDADVMQNERTRITSNLLNNGFYYFEPDFIYFEPDSNAHNQKVKLTVSVKLFPQFVNEDKDSTVLMKHTRYYVNQIYIITENLTRSFKDEYFKDTVVYNDYSFLMNKPSAYRFKLLAGNIEFFKNQVYQRSLAEKTYKRLINLGLFRSVLIQFVKKPGFNDQLDCYIICTPLIKKSLTVETEGTNTNGNLGVAGNILYQNKNLIRSAELFELKLNGSITAQKALNSTEQTTNIGDIKNLNDVNKVTRTFNTLQFGPEIKFSVPRAMFPFSLLPFKKDAFPRTFVNTSLNYQSRPEFYRSILTVDYGFSFRSKKGLLKHDLVPLEVYSVKAKLTTAFKDNLIATNDYFLFNSFIDHITTLSKYSITFNNQLAGLDYKRALHYLKVNVASSGSILRGLFNATDQPKDSLGRYHILNVPFAQFVKIDFDYRIYIPVYKRSKVVYRIAAGVGKPLANLNVLPYEQSFFSGGPNGVRAWRARTLGPGGYSQPDSVHSRYDKIGDLLLEANIEYRYHIFRDFYGAVFADAGNVWLLHNDPLKPGGTFEVDRFYKEIALGAGLGIRWDLKFLIVRLDAAVPLRDPKYVEEARWTFDKPKQLKQTILNFGIGYPF
jgi:outer membrane protein assembly factor BamA